MLFRIVEGCQS